MGQDRINAKGYNKYHEKVHTENFSNIGQAIFLKSLSVVDFKNNGVCVIKGNCLARNLKNVGSLKVDKLEAKRVDSYGSLHVNSDFSADEVNILGHINVLKTLNANKIDLNLTARSSIKEINAMESITVKKHNPLKLGNKHLKSKKIKAKVVKLEHTICDLVVGDIVTIGKGCEIQEVHYSQKLIKHTSAKIKSSFKTRGAV